MNIQIFGKSKCFDTKKAERYFKERRIKYQFVDIMKFGMSRGELNSVKNAVGLDNMINQNDVDYPLFNTLHQTTQSLKSYLNARGSSKRRSSATASRRPSATRRMSGQSGNKKKTA